MSLRDLWDELQVPAGREQTAAGRAGTAISHAVIGAALAWPILAAGLSSWAAVAAITVAYWALKEAGDIRRGGSPADSTIDTLFVALGVATAGQGWAPLVWVVLGGADGAWGRRLR